jgi:hypothetical protein
MYMYMSVFALTAICVNYYYHYWSYVLSLVGFVFACVSFYFQYTIHKINNSKHIWGLDYVMFDPLDQSSLISIFKMKTDPKETLEKMRGVLVNMRSDPKSFINRRIVKKGSKYMITYQETSQIVKVSDQKFISSIIKDMPLDCTEKKYIQTPYIPDFNKDDSSIEIVFDESSGKYYFKTNHCCYDGWTLLKIAGKLFDDDTTERYHLPLPKLVYNPFVFEYMFVKSMIQLLFLKKSQLAMNTDPKNYKIHQVVHTQTQITTDTKTTDTKTTDTKTLTNNTSKYGYLTLYVFKIMSVFFNAYPDRKYYNVTILAAINNPTKINNVSLIGLTIEKNDTIDIIDKKINSRKQQVITTYFLINSLYSSGNGKRLFDVCISSIPFYRKNDTLDIIGAIIPYNSCPVYVFNSKIGETSISSIHFGTPVLNVDTFVQSLNQSNITVRERTLLNDDNHVTEYSNSLVEPERD